MPDSVTAGVPPLSTLQSFNRGISGLATYVFAPGLDGKNFFVENGLMILSAIVVIFLLIMLLFFNGEFFASLAPRLLPNIHTAPQFSL